MQPLKKEDIVASGDRASFGYAELHCRSNFSFLAGASYPEELLRRASQLGLHSLAITDVAGVYGSVRAWRARKSLLSSASKSSPSNEGQQQFPPPRLLFGAELPLDPLRKGNTIHYNDTLIIIVRDLKGWSSLCELITRGRSSAPKGEFLLKKRDLLSVGGKHWFVLGGGPRGYLHYLLQHKQDRKLSREIGVLKESLGSSLIIEVSRHFRPGDHERTRALAVLAKKENLTIAATNDVLFHAPQRKMLHDLLTAIRHNTSLDGAGRRLLANSERCLKSPLAMARLFPDLPEAISSTVDLASRCDFSFEELKRQYPRLLVPGGNRDDEHLAKLAFQGLERRLTPRSLSRFRPRLERELKIIRELQYAEYFLSILEIITFCQERNILYQGRGSAANSLVCYALGITAVSPEDVDMLFERFISLERANPPDIDLDIEHSRREEVIQHVYNIHGRMRASMIAAVTTYRTRMALRDAGKALGYNKATLNVASRSIALEDEADLGRPLQTSSPHQDCDMISNDLSHNCHCELYPETARAAKIDPRGRAWHQLIKLSRTLIGFPRHLTLHSGAFLLSGTDIDQLVPIENAAMPGRTVIQWDKDDIQLLGWFKIDLLGLGILSVISSVFRYLKDTRGIDLELSSIEANDHSTFRMIQEADTIGVFQIESRAQMNILPRLRPGTFYDLVVGIALVRPGPIQAEVIHPYLRRRSGKERPILAHPCLEPILSRTLGIPIFQEQIMRIAVAVGGYSIGEADQLRRDLGGAGLANIGEHRSRLWQAMLERHISPPLAKTLLAQIEGFANYGFSEAHAASFAYLAYISAYLKRHYPTEFTAALLNAQPVGFYPISTVISDASRHGIKIKRIDVQYSNWDTSVFWPKSTDANCPSGLGARSCGELRLGLRLIQRLSKEDAEIIVSERARSPFQSIVNFAGRCQIGRRGLQALALGGAFTSLCSNRRKAFWLASALGGKDMLSNIDPRDGEVDFPPLELRKKIELDYRHTRVFMSEHPLTVHRDSLRLLNIIPASDLRLQPKGSVVKVAGLMLTCQRPGKGTMVFISLEDETGIIDLALHADVFRQYRSTIMLAEIIAAEGRLEEYNGVRNVLARSFRSLQEQSIGLQKRIFR